MALVDLNPVRSHVPPPAEVDSFLREATRRVERFQGQHVIPGFVPSDFPDAYQVLRDLAVSGLAPGRLFCEWGSGFGVVACLAAMLGFDACGVEIEGELVNAARRLAADFGLPVQFECGSFLSSADAARIVPGDGLSWLALKPGCAAGWEPKDFDVIFAYPWPGEEQLFTNLFERRAAKGAVFVTYHGGHRFQLRRKKGR